MCLRICGSADLRICGMERAFDPHVHPAYRIDRNGRFGSARPRGDVSAGIRLASLRLVASLRPGARFRAVLGPASASSE